MEQRHEHKAARRWRRVAQAAWVSLAMTLASAGAVQAQADSAGQGQSGTSADGAVANQALTTDAPAANQPVNTDSPAQQVSTTGVEPVVQTSPVTAAPVNASDPSLGESQAQNISLLPVVTDGLDSNGQLRLLLNRTRLLTTGVRLRSADRDGVALTEGSSDIATATPVSPTSILVTAKKMGSTNLILEDELGRRQLVEVSVEADLQALRSELKELNSRAAIDAVESNGSLVLHGRVPNLKVADQAAQIAGAYIGNPSKVINLLEVSGGQQVMLQVKFAEVSKSVESDLGINFGYTDGTTFAGSNIGQISPFGTSSTDLFAQALTASNPASAVQFFGNLKFNKSAFAYFINCLRENDLMRTLAEPNLTAISGETASFQVGGQIPIPVPQQGGAGSSSGASITIQYENYGVLLHFTPVVLGDGRIRLKIDPEVSDLDYTHGVSISGFVVPGFTTRTVDTTVELGDGQTFTIAGLLNNQVTATADNTPGMADLPILGALFRSVQYQRKQTELVVMVTPRLVEAMNPDEVTPGPGENWRYPSETDLFLSRDLGGDEAPKINGGGTVRTNGPAPRFQGEYGFNPTAETYVVEP